MMLGRHEDQHAHNALGLFDPLILRFCHGANPREMCLVQWPTTHQESHMARVA
jgi:hypothetical protein